MVPLLCTFGNIVYLGMVQKRYDGMNIWIPLNPTVWSVCRSLSLCVTVCPFSLFVTLFLIRPVSHFTPYFLPPLLRLYFQSPHLLKISPESVPPPSLEAIYIT